MSDRIGLRGWSIDSGVEPTLRVGVVLAEDDAGELSLRLPAGGYRLVPGDGPARDCAGPAELRVALRGGRLHAMLDGVAMPASDRLSIVPDHVQPLAEGAGVLVRDVVAGRGFHWHKRVDQTLIGRLDLLASDRGVVLVNELPLEAYLAGVITSEMSAQCPPEFLQAQCIAARSWLLAFTEPKHDHEPFDRCNDDCCQRYQGTGALGRAGVDAAAATRGLVLVAEGKVVDANYSKSCGGVVETPEHVWNIRKPGLGPLVDAPAGSGAQQYLPVTDANLEEYLGGAWLESTDIFCSPRVVDELTLSTYLGKVDESGRYFRWTVRQSHDQLAVVLRRHEPELHALARLDDLRVTRRGVSGRATQIVVAWFDAEGRRHETAIDDQYRIRKALHPGFLYSSAFAVDVERDGARLTAVTLRGAGWGHGAGLCQIGALGMALRHHSADQIVLHYFPGSRLDRVYA
jgi:SpoIID/LytB domain protein